MKLTAEQFKAKYPELQAIIGLNRGQLEIETGISFRPACGNSIIVGLIRIGDKLNVYPNGSKEYARLSDIAAEIKSMYATP